MEIFQSLLEELSKYFKIEGDDDTHVGNQDGALVKEAHDVPQTLATKIKIWRRSMNDCN